MTTAQTSCELDANLVLVTANYFGDKLLAEYYDSVAKKDINSIKRHIITMTTTAGRPNIDSFARHLAKEGLEKIRVCPLYDRDGNQIGLDVPQRRELERLTENYYKTMHSN